MGFSVACSAVHTSSASHTHTPVHPHHPTPGVPQVPFNIVNATVAYAVEDIVLGDLLYNKSVDFWWIDWQQGGSAGGMVSLQSPALFPPPPDHGRVLGCLRKWFSARYPPQACTPAVATRNAPRMPGRGGLVLGRRGGGVVGGNVHKRRRLGRCAPVERTCVLEALS